MGFSAIDRKSIISENQPARRTYRATEAPVGGPRPRRHPNPASRHHIEQFHWDWLVAKRASKKNTSLYVLSSWDLFAVSNPLH